MKEEIAPKFKGKKKKMLFLAEKETFVVRVLLKKAEEAGHVL